MKFNLTAENKLALTTFVPLLVAIGLLVFLIRLGMDKMNNINLKKQQSEKTVTLLNQKLSVLKDVTDNILSQTNIITIALPGENSTLIAAAQVKKYVVQNNLSLINIKAANEGKDKNDLVYADTTFEVQGDINAIYGLLDYINNMLPISRVGKIKISGVENQTRASVVFRTYWSKLPTKIPSLSEKTQELSDEDKKDINEIANMNLPQFLTLPPTEDNQNPNPFGI